MIFYSIEAKDRSNYNSRRWLVDYLGLRLVKQHYMNYPDKERPGRTIDRWYEFKVKKVDKVGFDFGGMWRQGTPIIREEIGKTTIEVPVTHIAFLVEALRDYKEKNKYFDNTKDYWTCGSRFWHYVMSIPHKKTILKRFQRKSKIYEEMTEGYNKDMDRAAEAAGIIQIRKYHQPKEQK